MKVNHPLAKRLRRWLRRHPWFAATLVVLAFVLKDLPEWLASVWSLRSSRPFLQVLTDKMQSLPHFSVYWITTPLGWLMLVVILYLLLTDRKAREVRTDKILSSPEAAGYHNQIAELKSQLALAENAAIEERNKAKELEKKRAEYPCPDEWLHKLARRDAQHLSIMVRVNKIVCRNEMRTGVLSYYYFHFVIENLTVYPVEIDRNISGSISLNGHPVLMDITLSAHLKLPKTRDSGVRLAQKLAS